MSGGILALDIATNTGWAYASGETLAAWPQTAFDWYAASRVAAATQYGSHNAKQLRTGATLAKHHTWLLGMLSVLRPRIVIYEAALPQSHKSASVARLIWGLCGITECCCSLHGCDVMEANLSTIRSHFLAGQRHGKTSADKKARVMDECLRRGFVPKDHDQSDALAVLDYGAVSLHQRFMRKVA